MRITEGLISRIYKKNPPHINQFVKRSKLSTWKMWIKDKHESYRTGSLKGQ